MKKLLALCALLALAFALPAGAPARKQGKQSHPRTTVLKGSFRAVGADGASSDTKFGKAQLVDNRKRDKLRVHLRRLAPRATYTFALYSVAKGRPRCEQGASGGTQETAFPPTSKQTNRRGNLNAKQRSKSFKAEATRRYLVLVSDGAQRVACAKLNGKQALRGCKPAAKRPAKWRGEHRAHAAKRGCKRPAGRHKRSDRGKGRARP